MKARKWWQACQTEMMTLFGQIIRRYPHLPTREEQLLRARLMFEEGGVEMIRASGCQLVYRGDVLNPGETVNPEDLAVEVVPGLEADEVAVADAIADTLVVTFGAANTYGQDAEGLYREVHRSNMSKLWDGPNGPEVRKREDGKVLKPPTYSPADLVTVLEGQRRDYLQEQMADAEALETALADESEDKKVA